MVPPILYIPTFLGVTMTLSGLTTLFSPRGFYQLFGLGTPAASSRDPSQTLVPLIGVRTLTLGVLLLYTSITLQVEVVPKILFGGAIVAGMDGWVAGRYGVERGWVSPVIGAGAFAGSGWWYEYEELRKLA